MPPMSTWRMLLASAAMAAALLTSCSSPPPPEPPSNEPEWNRMATGQGCARGRVACGVGNCVAKIDNACRQPVTCQLTVQSVCEAYTGESGEAIGRSKETIAPGDEMSLMARVLCDAGEVVATRAEKLRCR